MTLQYMLQEYPERLLNLLSTKLTHQLIYTCVRYPLIFSIKYK